MSYKSGDIPCWSPSLLKLPAGLVQTAKSFHIDYGDYVSARSGRYQDILIKKPSGKWLRRERKLIQEKYYNGMLQDDKAQKALDDYLRELNLNRK